LSAQKSIDDVRKDINELLARIRKSSDELKKKIAKTLSDLKETSRRLEEITRRGRRTR